MSWAGESWLRDAIGYAAIFLGGGYVLALATFGL